MIAATTYSAEPATGPVTRPTTAPASLPSSLPAVAWGPAVEGFRCGLAAAGANRAILVFINESNKTRWIYPVMKDGQFGEHIEFELKEAGGRVVARSAITPVLISSQGISLLPGNACRYTFDVRPLFKQGAIGDKPGRYVLIARAVNLPTWNVGQDIKTLLNAESGPLKIEINPSAAPMPAEGPTVQANPVTSSSR